jgi:hypothetical protein
MAAFYASIPGSEQEKRNHMLRGPEYDTAQRFMISGTVERALLIER